MKRVLVEGWRDTTQSYSMVNQFQLIALLRCDGILLFHRDLPFLNSQWGDPSNMPGFLQATADAIRSIPPPNDVKFEVVYRISAPFSLTRTPAQRAITFMTSEYGCTANRFAPDQWNPELYCEGDNCVVTPSVWSKNKLVEYGFPDQKVCVVPHGVCGEIFYPSGEVERTLVRTQLGLIDEHVAFLSVGALSWNKGLDYLVRAFVEIHQKYPIARLLLKDASSLYGMTTVTFFKEYTRLFGAIPRETWDAIRVVPSSQSLESMRQLYSAADCYVSPYRAEGFNLPVIEAIACGTPVIVSDGGATDDFCDLRTSLKVECDHVLNTDRDLDIPGTHLEPRIDSLVEQMRKVVSGEFCTNETFVEGWRDLREAYSWKASVQKLVNLF